jgi:2-oxo-4-hydroxy-4-carboxy-5-ureidoimidazoline decarboxylase
MDEMGKLTLADLNSASDEDFRAALDGCWEHSPWVVEAVMADRPFASLDTLIERMEIAVRDAGEERQLALLGAHPDLAGKMALAGELTADSAREQASAGLDRLSKFELPAFREWNERYRMRNGFPFIICVRDHTKNSMRAAFRRRLSTAPNEEWEVALAEVRKIAEHRLRDRIAE